MNIRPPMALRPGGRERCVMGDLNKRVLDWIRFDNGPACETMRCDGEAKYTDAGMYCLPCYMVLSECAVQNCYRPMAKLQRRDGLVCREHYMAVDDNAQIEAQRRHWRRASSVA